MYFRTAWRNALDKWEEVSPLRFTEIPRYSRQSVDIRIEFGSYDHGDGYPFDGPGKHQLHYANMHMQYAAILKAVKIVIFR